MQQGDPVTSEFLSDGREKDPLPSGSGRGVARTRVPTACWAAVVRAGIRGTGTATWGWWCLDDGGHGCSGRRSQARGTNDGIGAGCQIASLAAASTAEVASLPRPGALPHLACPLRENSSHRTKARSNGRFWRPPTFDLAERMTVHSLVLPDNPPPWTTSAWPAGKVRAGMTQTFSEPNPCFSANLATSACR